MPLSKFLQIRQSVKDGIAGDGGAFFAGTLLTLAFAPFSLFPLAIISTALLLWLWLNTSTLKRTFLRGWLYGLGFFGTGVSWVFISIHTFGNASILLATVITSSFIAVLALFPAFHGYWLNRYFPDFNGRKILCVFPAIGVLLEWIRSWIFTGFPWLLLGESQINSPLKGFAPVFGTYGISLAVLLSSGLLVNALYNAKKDNIIQPRNIYLSLIALAALWIAGASLTCIAWTKSYGKPIQVSLIQGNIAQELQWAPNQILPILKRYQTLTEAHWHSQIIIWPEDAIPLPLPEADNFITQLNEQAKKNHATLITGIPVKHATEDSYYNAIIVLGENHGGYAKRHLLPFGEYTPFPRLLKPIMKMFNIPMSNLIPGGNYPAPLLVNGIKIAAFICYEIAYPELVVSHEADIGMLLTISNDAWFGDSIAQAQHLAIAQLRALENGRAALFVSNTGITAIIRPDGTLQSAAPPATAFVLTGSVQPTTGKTPWQHYGMDLILIIVLVQLFSTIIFNRSQKEKKSAR